MWNPAAPITFDIPKVREGGFYPQALVKGLRSERALMLALAEMYVQGVSTRKVAAITERNAAQMVLFSDQGFVKLDWIPENVRICQRGEWNARMIVEMVLSMLTLVCHFRKVMHRVWAYFQSRLAYTMAMFNLLVQWDGIQVDENGCVHFSLAPFSL